MAHQEKKHLFSVIVPTRNRSRVLLRALQALDEQDREGRPFEVIVVDDGSTDDTEELLAGLSLSFPFYRLRQESKGPAAARNRGLERAGGRTLLFLNDDCLAAPDLLSQHRYTLGRLGEVAVLGYIDWVKEMKEGELKELIEKYYFPYRQVADREKVNFSYFITGNLSVPARRVREAGGFDEEFTEASFEDIELGYRLQKNGLDIGYNPGAVAYHLHPLDFDHLYDRQYKVAYWLPLFLRKHPEAASCYSGADILASEIPAKKKACLEMLLRYAGHRGLKKGRADF